MQMMYLAIFQSLSQRHLLLRSIEGNCESQVASARPGFTPAKLAGELDVDFQALPLLWCARGDAVRVRRFGLLEHKVRVARGRVFCQRNGLVQST